MIFRIRDIVKTTVGPNGRNVLIKENGKAPLITNDGVTIAKSIQLKDKAKDAGAQLIIQAANKTNEVAGDRNNNYNYINTRDDKSVL